MQQHVTTVSEQAVPFPTMSSPAMLALLLALLLTAASALTFKVNSASRQADESPGDGVCATAERTCTLQAALEESNARGTRDVIFLPSGVYRTDGTGTGRGLPVRESVQIRGASAQSVVLSGGKAERHFNIVNEKLILGLRDGAIGAIRPSSGRPLRDITPSGDLAAAAGAFVFSGNELFATFFTLGVARYVLRSRETIERSANKFPYAFDRIVVPSSGGMAGLTTPTAIERTSNGDLLVNSFQPTSFSIRRYDGTTFALKSIFITQPGIVNSMVRLFSKLYLTLVSSREVRAYDTGTGAFIKSASDFLNTPRGISTCGLRLFVASEKSNALVEFDEELDFIQVLQDSRLNQPQGLACLDRDLFVKNKGSSTILHYRIRESGTRGFDFVRELSTGSSAVAGIAAYSGRDHVDGVKVNLLDMTLKNGRVSSGSGPSLSIARGSTVKVDRCVITKNVGSTFGGAVTNSGTTLIQNSRLVSNSGPMSTLSGGGVTNSGGAIGNFGQMTLRWSELSNNQAARGGAIWNSGSEGVLIVFQCTISNNYAGNAGGGIYNTRFAQVKFSTITENRCGEFSRDPITRRAGCGFYSFRDPSKFRQSFLISRSIIANNVQVRDWGTYAPDCLAEVSQAVISSGGNIIGGMDADACKIIGRSDFDRRGARLEELDPGLGPLKFLPFRKGKEKKVSFTRGHNPVKRKLANLYNPFVGGQLPSDACPGKDQIGRVRLQSGICDVGAIERGQ